MPKPVPLKLRTYDIIAEAVHQGVQYGMTRAYKYSDDPSSDHIADTVELAVMNQLSDVVDWSTPEETEDQQRAACKGDLVRKGRR